jgi:hypothetical protein
MFFFHCRGNQSASSCFLMTSWGRPGGSETRLVSLSAWVWGCRSSKEGGVELGFFVTRLCGLCRVNVWIWFLFDQFSLSLVLFIISIRYECFISYSFWTVVIIYFDRFVLWDNIVTCTSLILIKPFKFGQ